MMFYVETGVKFTNDFGDIDEGFYSSMERTYVAALTLMKKENLLEKFTDRAGKVVSDTSGIGWCFMTIWETFILTFLLTIQTAQTN